MRRGSADSIRAGGQNAPRHRRIENCNLPAPCTEIGPCVWRKHEIFGGTLWLRVPPFLFKLCSSSQSCLIYCNVRADIEVKTDSPRFLFLFLSGSARCRYRTHERPGLEASRPLRDGAPSEAGADHREGNFVRFVGRHARGIAGAFKAHAVNHGVGPDGQPANRRRR